MLLNYILEWLSWILLFFSWAVLIKVALKKSNKRMKDDHVKLQRKLYWSAMSIGILCFVLSILFIADPIVSFVVGMDYVSPENGPVVFLLISASFFLLLPFLIVPVIIRILFKKKSMN